MNHAPFATVAVFLFSYSLYLLWLAFIHQVRGENLSKEGKNVKRNVKRAGGTIF